MTDHEKKKIKEDELLLAHVLKDIRRKKRAIKRDQDFAKFVRKRIKVRKNGTLGKWVEEGLPY